MSSALPPRTDVVKMSQYIMRIEEWNFIDGSFRFADPMLWNIDRADGSFAPPIALLSPSPPPSMLLPPFCFYRARENPRPFRHESFFGRVCEHLFFWHPQRIKFPFAFFFFVEIIDEMLHALQARLNALKSFIACIPAETAALQSTWEKRWFRKTGWWCAQSDTNRSRPRIA
jgi:hypothetical protein